MGFIPLFIMLGGGSLLFFLIVKNSLQRKLNQQKELLFKLNSLNPALGILVEDASDPDLLIAVLKEKQTDIGTTQKALKIIRDLKVNRIQYNALLKKAPYNWVGKIARFQAI
ncbi:hypothetical protein [Algoriphagus persicinus]|uniref:hypothetical protein n=1 Tax=Algoriphagus persicinus TaxID=3108754 RepID=UPI002B3A8FBD|nr:MULTISPECIES: hypothetical protein [unclassified Algoriphagus]MEB2781712.1 hypothetical protein [Algoriphagus sp. C2-6-M1]MEB2785385.1 hypothetical protein [Algoriphagus sp. E1-3-M2]